MKNKSRRQALKSFIGLGVLQFIGFKNILAAIPDECLTTDDLLGPFFIENSPEISVIAPANPAINRLFITGTVYAKDCVTPIPNAIIDVWQANNDGTYENVDYRAKIYSDENGNYAFESILPGKYLNGNQFRPSHIHYKVVYLNNPVLTTQLYFEGDTSIDIDPWASSAEAIDRIIPLTTDANNNQNGVFDIFLDADTTAIQKSEGNDQTTSIQSIFPNPVQNDFEIKFYNRKNSHIKTLKNEEMTQGMKHLQFSELNISSGLYVIRLWENNQAIDAKRIVVR
jgi:catechol 1,2-dioxygenase